MIRNLGQLSLCSMTLVIVALAAWAQSPPAAASAAPLPSQIASAKKVFISNLGMDSGSALIFKRDQAEDKPYNEFYAAVRAWGRYQLVESPAEADLIYEIRFLSPIVRTGKLDSYAPQFNLSIVDARTHFTLWTLLETVDPAYRRVTWDKNFATGLTNLMADLKKLSAPAEAPSQTDNK